MAEYCQESVFGRARLLGSKPRGVGCLSSLALTEIEHDHATARTRTTDERTQGELHRDRTAGRRQYAVSLGLPFTAALDERTKRRAIRRENEFHERGADECVRGAPYERSEE